MELKEILHKIKIENRLEYINDLLKTTQVRSIISCFLDRYKEDKNEVKAIIEYNIKLLLLKNYKYQENFTEEKFITYLRKTLPTRIHRMFNEKFVTESYFFNIDDFEIDNWEAIDNKIDLMIAINNLSDIQRKIINKYYFYGKTEKEIAEDLGVTQTYVSQVKKTTIQNLKNYFQK